MGYKKEQTINRNIGETSGPRVTVLARKLGDVEYIFYSSAAATENATGISSSNILLCCKGLRKSYGDYEFKCGNKEFENLEGEEWKPFLLEHYNKLRALPKPTRNVEKDAKRLKKYRDDRQEKHRKMREERKSEPSMSKAKAQPLLQ